jgi:DNA helicase II / ATP-dependent DNA helicase PcrA
MDAPLYTPAGIASAGAGAMEEILRDLNPSQRAAVTHPGGPLLVVAGAGTGKTRVLTRRIAWRIANGASPRATLAITFTNKAADVLKQRLAALPGGGEVTAGTFHSFCASVLRRFADRVGGDRSFTILDSDDQERLIKDLLRRLEIDPKQFTPREFADAISLAKAGGEGRAAWWTDDPGFHAALARVRPAYDERLRASALYDFDDLLVETVRLLEEVPDAASALRGRWRHLLVDEYQDTNTLQLRILKGLAGAEPDLCAVGDPDQSIYRWRGATIRNILRFADDFPGATVVKLEQNYRSTARILAVAEEVIRRNTERYDKRLTTANPEGERATEIRFRDGVEEASGVAALLRRWLENGVSPSSVAVFFRANHLTRGVETMLRASAIPYQVVSGIEFFQRREVKDVLAYARLLENPRDESAFLRVVNVPRRGIGDGALERMKVLATERGVSVPEVAHEKVPGASKRAQEGIVRFLAVLARLRGLPRAPVAPVLKAILEDTGYRADLASREDDIERFRVENVDELVTAAKEFDVEEGGDLRLFLERASLVADQDAFDEATERVSLMTVHAAKGLEFDRVIVVGAEEGLFPHARSLSTPGEVEEERRLFYVALTRARERLVVTIASERSAWKGLELRRPSRFWLDVPDALVESVDRGGTWDRARARREQSAAESGEFAFDEPPPAEGSSHGDVTGAPAGEDAVFERGGDDVPAAGERVVHPYFGAGTLLSSSGRGAARRVVVEFDAWGTKTIAWDYARLEREGGPGGGAR